MDDPSETVLISLRRILKATEANVKSLASESGLTASQLLVLQWLTVKGEMLNGDLARAVDLKQATMSTLIDKLRERGLVDSRRGETDKRRVWLRITDKGERVLRGAPDLLQDNFRARFALLADWEQALIAASLLRVVSLLDAEQIDAAPVLHLGGVAELPAEPTAARRRP